MRYFHRTSIAPDDVLAEADGYFGERLQCSDAGDRRRTFSGTVGRIDLTVEAEGGHYTLINVVTDQVGESEADRVAKRFLSMVHKRAEPEHEVKGAY
jgi:hypothetical protein